MTFLTRASAILDRGFSTIPLQANEKTPLTTNGAKNRTRDRNVVAAWSEQHPNANAAIIADENHVILESDDAERLLQYLTTLGVSLPSTFTQQARLNRPHWIFKRPDFRVENLTIPGVFEFKAENLYVVGFGSIHPTGAEYVITDPRDPVLLPLNLWDALQQMREARMGYENPASRFVAPGPVALLKAEVKRFPYCGEWDVLLDDDAAAQSAEFRIGESERHYSLMSLAGTFRNAFPEASAEDLCQKLGKVRDHFCDDGGRAITDGELMNIATWVEKREAVSSPLVVMGAPLPLSAPTPTPLTVTVTLPSTPSDLIEELAES